MRSCASLWFVPGRYWPDGADAMRSSPCATHGPAPAVIGGRREWLGGSVGKLRAGDDWRELIARLSRRDCGESARGRTPSRACRRQTGPCAYLNTSYFARPESLVEGQTLHAARVARAASWPASRPPTPMW